MIYLLFALLLAQMTIILSLLFQTPIREPLVVGLDGLKRGRAPWVIKSIGASMFIVTMYNIYTLVEIGSNSVDAVNSINRVDLAYQYLEASLVGFSLFLMLMIDNLHQYLRELITLTEAIGVARKQNRVCDDSIKKNADAAKSIKEEISKLRTKIIKLESECNGKEKEAHFKNANSDALKNQLEGFLVEYDRLLADNKDLKDQLQDFSERSPHSSGKKTVFFSWDQWGF